MQRVGAKCVLLEDKHQEVVTDWKEPLEWESELRGECGSLSLRCFHFCFTSGLKADVFKSWGRGALPAPGLPWDREHIEGPCGHQ